MGLYLMKTTCSTHELWISFLPFLLYHFQTIQLKGSYNYTTTKPISTAPHTKVVCVKLLLRTCYHQCSNAWWSLITKHRNKMHCDRERVSKETYRLPLISLQFVPCWYNILPPDHAMYSKYVVSKSAQN